MRKESGVPSQEPEAPRALPGGADKARSDMSASEVAGTAQPVGGASSKEDENRSKKVYADFRKLEPQWQKLAEQLIEEGSSVEDIVEIFAERGGPIVTEHAIEVHYQASFELQKRRAAHLVEQADELRRKLSDPNSDDARLANATLLLGLVQLRRNSSRLTIKDAHSLRMQRQNLQLRQRVLKMKLADQVRKKSEAHQRYLWEEERRRHLQLENQKLMEILKKLRQDQSLPADVMTKIQEIYGIVKEPYISPKLAEMLPQSETP